MKQLIKAEKYRLYYSVDNIGIVFIGAAVTIFFCVFMQLLTYAEDGNASAEGIMLGALQSGSYAILVFVILTENYIIGCDVRNNLVKYELLKGYSYGRIWLVKQLFDGGLITIVFCGFLVLGFSFDTFWMKTNCIDGLCYRILLLALVVFRLSFAAMIYIYVIQNFFLSTGLFLLIQMFAFPKLSEMIGDNKIGKIPLYNIAGILQLGMIWDGINLCYMLKEILVGMLIEVIIVYVIGKVYLERKK